jgi:hypothetical protein
MEVGMIEHRAKGMEKRAEGSRIRKLECGRRKIGKDVRQDKKV